MMGSINTCLRGKRANEIIRFRKQMNVGQDPSQRAAGVTGRHGRRLGHVGVADEGVAWNKTKKKFTI